MQIKLSMTVAELADYWLENYSKPHKKTWTEDEGRIRLYIKPLIGHLLIDEVRRADVAKLHAQVGEHAPYQANRTRENLHTMFSQAEIWGFLPDGHPNPASKIKDFKEKQRLRFLSDAEIVRLFESIAVEHDIYLRAAILLLLFTALRRNEILTLEWSNVNLQEKYLIIPDDKTKNGDGVVQPLNLQALQVLSMTPRRSDNRYVICGWVKGNHRVDLKRAWDRITKRANLRDFHVHDLRRTVGAWMASNGVAIQVIQKVLNHKDLKTTLIYARVADEAKKKALTEFGSSIARLIS